MNFKKLALTAMLFGFASAQSVISGTVTDAKTNDALIGANVLVKGTTIGTAADLDGRYSLKVEHGSRTLQAIYVGYVNQEKKISVNGEMTVDFAMAADVFSKEVTVVGKRAKFRETPVAFTNIEPEEIAIKAATQDVSMLLNEVPGVYATENGGGSGDSQIQIRGFSVENIAVMINGVPVNDMENGWVYWSNWSGLGDVAQTMQVQRGLGASKLSAASVGGSVNIITRATETEQKLNLKSSYGSYNTKKILASYSTGLMENGWALSFMGSKKVSDGYADQTWSEDYTYFVSVGKAMEEHSLNLNISGSPQKHGQRFNKQSKETWEQYGKASNIKSWGLLNNKPYQFSVNKYHKPVLDLNHIWQVNEDITMNNIVYASYGRGYGQWQKGIKNVDDNGVFMIDDYVATNKASTSGAESYVYSSNNDHNWYGLISSFDMKMENDLNLSAGLDARVYEGKHYRVLEDLLGAEYYYDSGYTSVDSLQRIVKEGDKFLRDNTGFVNQYGVFAQAEKKWDHASSFVNLSAYNKSYTREEAYNKLEKTKQVSFIGGHLKFGINYNIDENQNIFGNAGFLSVAPGFDRVIDRSNNINETATNEKTYSGELGYGFHNNLVVMNVNAYYTLWTDRYYSKSIVDEKTNERLYVNFPDGVSERHYGIEFEAKYVPVDFLEIEASGTIANHKFEDNYRGVFEDANDNEIGSLTFYLKDTYVPNQPMITANIGVNYKNSFDGINIFVNPRLSYVADQYAHFSPDSKTKPEQEGLQAWKIPSYSKYDLTAGATFDMNEFGFNSVSLIANVFNLFDKDYITTANDGKDHNLDSSYFFYGSKRYYSLGLNVNF